jgi:hypothetical protein
MKNCGKFRRSMVKANQSSYKLTIFCRDDGGWQELFRWRVVTANETKAGF